MWGQRYHCKFWELLLDSSQFLLGKRSGKHILVIGGSDVLLGTEFLCLGGGDKSLRKLGCKDPLWGSKIVVVNIRHEYDSGEWEMLWAEGSKGLAHMACIYMCF